MNIIDVYDIAKSTWYKQLTVGEYPRPRVNPCAVVAAAPEYVKDAQRFLSSANMGQWLELQRLYVCWPSTSTLWVAKAVRRHVDPFSSFFYVDQSQPGRPIGTHGPLRTYL